MTRLSSLVLSVYGLYEWIDIAQFASLFGIHSLNFLIHWFAITLQPWLIYTMNFMQPQLTFLQTSYLSFVHACQSDCFV